jgi:hypothetical protein
MASIAVIDLYKTGIELFQDSESYLNELSYFDRIHGGQYLTATNIASYAYPPSLTAIFFPIEKGYEFAVYTYAIDAIVQLAKSYSVVSTNYGCASNGLMNITVTP